jgi:hypothetical protein
MSLRPIALGDLVAVLAIPAVRHVALTFGEKEVDCTTDDWRARASAPVRFKRVG